MAINTLLLFVNADNELFKIDLDRDGDVIRKEIINDVSVLSEKKPDHKSMLLLPGEKIFSQRVAMPETSQRNRSKALPYLLESHCLTQPDDLHYVTTQLDKRHIQVTAIDKKVMQSIVKKLASCGAKPYVAMPDYLALPLTKDGWAIAIDGDLARVRIGIIDGFTTTVSHLIFLLERKLRDYKQPINITVFGDHALDFSSLSDKFGFSYHTRLRFDAASCLIKPAVNLLTGAYRVKSRLMDLKKRYWYGAVAMLGLWLIVVVLGQSLMWIKTHHQLAELKKAIAVIEKRSGSRELIAQKLIVSPESETDNFVKLLLIIGKALSASVGVSIDSLHFIDDSLSLTLSSSQLANFESFIKQLRRSEIKITANQVRRQKLTVINTLTVSLL